MPLVFPVPLGGVCIRYAQAGDRGGRCIGREEEPAERDETMPATGLVVAQVEGVTVVSFRTASILDLATMEAIAAELYALVDEQARKKIVLDFASVRFLSSSMLGILISLQKRSKTIGGRVVHCAMRPELMKIFQITKLDRILEFAPDEGEALKKLDVLGRA